MATCTQFWTHTDTHTYTLDSWQLGWREWESEEEERQRGEEVPGRGGVWAMNRYPWWFTLRLDVYTKVLSDTRAMVSECSSVPVSQEWTGQGSSKKSCRPLHCHHHHHVLLLKSLLYSYNFSQTWCSHKVKNNIYSISQESIWLIWFNIGKLYLHGARFLQAVIKQHK